MMDDEGEVEYDELAGLDEGDADESAEPKHEPKHEAEHLHDIIENAIDNQLAAKNPLRGYSAHARKNGTTLTNAVKDYHAVETALRQDYAHGSVNLAARMGASSQQMVAAARALMAAANGGYAPRSGQTDYAVDFARHQGDVARFGTENSHFETVRQDMARLVLAGQAHDIQTAYRMAIGRHPQLAAQAAMDEHYAARERDLKPSRRRR